MIFRSSQFRKPLALLALLLGPLLAHAEPDASAILEAARLNPLGQQTSLNAQLRTASTKTPFTITVDGTIRYGFTSPDQELILELKDNSSVLSERLGGKSGEIRAARFDNSVRGTGITYEDLALRFLYWKNPKMIDTETIRGRKTWKMEVQSGRDSSQYGVARLWIDQESGALLRIEGYNRDGKLLRKFEVVSAQKIDGQWMLKEMRVEMMNPETKKIINRTYLEVLGKAEAQPPA